MAIKVMSLTETFEVALFQDEALDMSRKDYLEYIKTCDKSLLKLKPGQTPTYFQMKKVLKYEDGKKVQGKQLGYKDDMVVMDNSFSIEDVRLSLCAVINPSDLPLEHHLPFSIKDGGADPDTMALLLAYNAVDDLYMAKQFITGAKDNGLEKEKKK